MTTPTPAGPCSPEQGTTTTPRALTLPRDVTAEEVTARRTTLTGSLAGASPGSHPGTGWRALYEVVLTGGLPGRGKSAPIGVREARRHAHRATHPHPEGADRTDAEGGPA